MLVEISSFSATLDGPVRSTYRENSLFTLTMSQ